MDALLPVLSSVTDEFPGNAFGAKGHHLYTLLTRTVGIPSAVSGPTIQHAINAYANAVAEIVSGHGRKGPLGLNTMVSGVSGCGKTEAKNAAFAEMFAFQRECLANADGDDRIETHVLNNATMSATIKALAQYPIANEIDDEFSSSQTGSMTRNANIRNQLYDGQTFSVDRTTSGRYILHDPRFTSLVLTQPHVRVLFDEKHGKRLRTMGLATRTQFSEYSGEPCALHMVRLDTAQWDSTCKWLLYTWLRIYSNNEKRREVKFSASAMRAISSIREQYLQRGRQQGDLSLFPEHVARQPENICRIAAGTHVFEDLSGDISADTVEQAAMIGLYYTDQYVRRFMPKPTMPAAELYAQTLHPRLAALVKATRQREFELRGLVDTAPNIGLTPSQAKRAFDFLCSSGHARYVKYGKEKWVGLSPEHYPLVHFLG
ncbi:DUF3987 domain-containing protein [Ralstonia pickettii]|uniref:DUF3987 domain-containing protein n=1 Tax=Ralstonia pickettii TaxID=329 RepID=UPI0004698A9A|nr:DUF3987 domain-containing protein [Ralstonia pickettii]